MKAWQRQIRERRAVQEERETLFGRYWDGLDLSIEHAVVRPVSYVTAAKLIEEYEWLGCMPAISTYCFGIYFDGVLGGVVVYGPDYIENLGRWDKYGYTGKMLLLARGACVHWAHPHSGSKLVRESMKQLPPEIEVVTATVDDLAGEIGTIYQACGFHYVGSMRDANPNVHSRKGDRDGWIIGGKLYGSRAMRLKFDTTSLDVIRGRYPDAQKVKQNSKGRYFAFRGNRGAIKRNRRAIAHLIKPYPKRAGEGSSSDPSSFHEEGAGAVPAPRSNFD